MDKDRYRFVRIVLASIAFVGCDRGQQTNVPATPMPMPAPESTAESPAQEVPAEITSRKAAIPQKGDDGPLPVPAEIAREFRGAAEADRRGELAQALWEIATPEAVETLRQLFVTEREADVKVDIVSGVSENERPELRDGCHALLLAALTPGQPPEVRALSAHLLTESKDPRAIALLQQFAQDGDAQVREAAREALEARRENDSR